MLHIICQELFIGIMFCPLTTAALFSLSKLVVCTEQQQAVYFDSRETIHVIGQDLLHFSIS